MELTNFKEIKDIILKRWKKGDILREYFREKYNKDFLIFPWKIKLKSPTSKELSTNTLEIFNWKKALKETDKSVLAYGYNIIEKKINNKIIGKLSECTFGSKTKKVEKLYADLSEAQLSFVEFTSCDLTETIRPEDPDILYIKNLSERSKKAQEKIATIQDDRKRRALSIHTESWMNEKYVDYLMSRKDYKWAWDDYFEDVSKCLELDWAID